MAFTNKTKNTSNNDIFQYQKAIQLAKYETDTIISINSRDYYQREYQQRPVEVNVKDLLYRLINEAKYGQRGRQDKLMYVKPNELISIYEYINKLESLIEKEQEQHCIDSPDLEF